jgi:hypothetical protein
MQTPAELGLKPGMQVVQRPLLQVWHLSGQVIQAELTRERPLAQEVHWVMLDALQLEQVEAHPLQLPFATTNPRLQVRQMEELVQVMQLVGHPPVQLPPTKVCPGGQPVQPVALPTQVVQDIPQATQVELTVRKALEMQLLQTLGESVVQARQFGPHFTHKLVVESNANPFMHPKQTPFE